MNKELTKDKITLSIIMITGICVFLLGLNMMIFPKSILMMIGGLLVATCGLMIASASGSFVFFYWD